MRRLVVLFFAMCICLSVTFSYADDSSSAPTKKDGRPINLPCPDDDDDGRPISVPCPDGELKDLSVLFGE